MKGRVTSQNQKQAGAPCPVPAYAADGSVLGTVRTIMEVKNITDFMEDRWSLPDPGSVPAWCRMRGGQGVRCTVATMAEFAGTPAEAGDATRSQIAGIRRLAGIPGAAWAVKPSAIGLLADPRLFDENLLTLARETGLAGISLEIDMEGRPLVDATIRSALALTGRGIKVTLAIQAYLDRTTRDLVTCTAAGIPIRLVKGTYLGDTSDFIAIQERFRRFAATLIAAEIPFAAATHDPDLIAWLEKELADRHELVEFGFLKGLADQTKLRLAAGGWKVAEYVPFGPGGDAYRLRRERYLRMLDQLGREPAP